MFHRTSFARNRASNSLGIENLEQRELLAADLMDAQSAIPDRQTGPPDQPAIVNNEQRRDRDDRGRRDRPDDQDGLPIEPLVRSIDGTGNNVANGDWGSAGATLIRMADADFEDGISVPAGSDRPSAREISNVLSQNEDLVSDDGLSAMVYVWGQFIDHDISLTPSGSEAFNIEVPAGDEYFDPFNTGTAEIRLNRANPVTEAGDTPLEYPNVITAWIDGSGVYGSDDATAVALRTMEGGKLKTSDGDMLPFNNAETFPEGTLDMDNDANIVSDAELFAAGDIRANENIELTSIHTLFVREHNRLADEIAATDPSLSDEQIYQRARAIVVGQLQAITYNEFLPSVVGDRAIGRYDGYDPSVNPNVSIEFSAAAFRFGHSMLGDDVEFLDNVGNEIAEELPLSEAFSNPSAVSENGIDSIIKYLASDPSSELDLQVVDSVRNFLFGPPGAGGFDLVSLNIQRGRDVGLADYNSTREAYGLEPVESFADITDNVDAQQNLESLYGSVDNIDLWVGGLAEDHVRGASIGETFQTIVADQFERIRDGDRGWYQNVFSGDMLRSLERTTLTDVIERNTQLTNLQENTFYFEASVSGQVETNTGDGLEGQTVELQAEGEVIASTLTDARGQYSFDVFDGLRTGEYEIHWISESEEPSSPSHEVIITTGDTHLRSVDFVFASLDTDTDSELDADTERSEDQDDRRRRRRRR